jgi:uncharacterized protein YlxW (UPF0749 family)
MGIRRRNALGLFLCFALLGFLLVTQIRGHESRSGDLESKSMDDLTNLVGTLSQENDRLQAEIADLRLRVLNAQLAGKNEAGRIAEQEQTLAQLQLVTGVIGGNGRGVHIELRDPKGELDAFDLNQLVNELKSAGAEAVVVDGLRVHARSSFAESADTLVMSGVPLATPVTIDAVGNQSDLVSSLTMAGGVVPSLEARPGVVVHIDKRSEISVPADGHDWRFVYAAKSKE